MQSFYQVSKVKHLGSGKIQTITVISDNQETLETVILCLLGCAMSVMATNYGMHSCGPLPTKFETL